MNAQTVVVDFDAPIETVREQLRQVEEAHRIHRLRVENLRDAEQRLWARYFQAGRKTPRVGVSPAR